MTPGNVALARIQQADGRLKVRPVLILSIMPPFHDFLVCGLSSKVRPDSTDFEEAIAEEDSDFRRSGLKVASQIRLGMLATIPESAVLGRLGAVADDRLKRLRLRLARHLREAP